MVLYASLGSIDLNNSLPGIGRKWLFHYCSFHCCLFIKQITLLFSHQISKFTMYLSYILHGELQRAKTSSYWIHDRWCPTDPFTLIPWNEKFGGFPHQASWNYCAFSQQRTFPSCMLCTLAFLPSSAPPRASPKHGARDWKRPELRTFPSLNSPSPCARHFHKYRCSRPGLISV